MRVFWGARRKARERKSPQAALCKTEITAEALGVARGVESPPQKCVVTLFAARGPEEPLEPWRCVEGGPFGIAAMRFEALGLASFQGHPRAPRGEGPPRY